MGLISVTILMLRRHKHQISTFLFFMAFLALVGSAVRAYQWLMSEENRVSALAPRNASAWIEWAMNLELPHTLLHRLNECQHSDRPHSWPFSTGDTWRCLADYEWTGTELLESPAQLGRYPIVFIPTSISMLESWFAQHHPHIDSPYMLVTHNSDEIWPEAMRRHLDDPKLLLWFAQNVPHSTQPLHTKLIPIPIMMGNAHWNGLRPDEWQSIASFQHALPLALRPRFMLASFKADTVERRQLHVKLQRQVNRIDTGYTAFAGEQHDRQQAHAIRIATQYRYVVSPAGNGIDCHRTWEALLMGAIPIVCVPPGTAHLYQGTGILTLSDWTQLIDRLDSFDAHESPLISNPRFLMPYYVARILDLEGHWILNGK